MPLVSIIIPVYNGANYLNIAIESALGQDYANIEIIVINDGSKDADETKRIALTYKDKIRYYEKKNGGVATALNYGIGKAKGDYISWLSHDDEYLPNKIKSQIDFLNKFDGDMNTAILSSDILVIDAHGKQLGRQDCRFDENGAVYEMLMRGTINGCTLLIPRKAFQEIGGFDPSLKTTQDYHLWFRFIKAGYQFHHLSEALVKSRTHPEQDSQKKIDIATRERRELEKFAFSIFSPEDFAKGSLSRCNPTALVLRMKATLFAKRAIPTFSKWTKKIGIYDFIAPIYTKYVLKK